MAARNNDISFSKVQRIQHLEEKTNEAHLVLEANARVLSALRQDYASTTRSEDFPFCIRESCKHAISGFLHRLEKITENMNMQKSQLDLILRFLSNRKNLVTY